MTYLCQDCGFVTSDVAEYNDHMEAHPLCKICNHPEGEHTKGYLNHTFIA